MPLSTYYDVGDAGTEISLRVHTHVREDALQLFGFLHAARAAAVRAPDRHQRHRAEARASRCSPASSRRELVVAVQRARPRAAHRHSRRRQEDRRAHRARAEGSPRAMSRRPTPAPRNSGRAPIACATTSSRRSRTWAIIGRWPRRRRMRRARATAAPSSRMR